MPVAVEVTLYKQPCESCAQPFWWVMWMRAVSPEPADWITVWPGGPDRYHKSSKDYEMPVMSDQPAAVASARTLLRRLGQHSRAQQLVDRRPGLKGASYNSNRCPRCRHVADWHYFESTVVEAIHQQDGFYTLGPADLPTVEWAAAVNEQHTVWCI